MSFPEPVFRLGRRPSVSETLVLLGVLSSEEEANEPGEKADKYK